MTEMSMLNLYLLGPPRVELAGRPLEIKRRKVMALLSYLALSGERQPRDTLATLLWPDSSQQSARKALRRDLSELNLALAGDWLDPDRESVGLRAGFWLDVTEFQQYLANEAADLQTLIRATNLYRDDFLTGFTLPDCPEFDEWQFFQTESLRQALASALERLVGLLSGQADYERAIPYARRRLALDPLHEPAHRQLMWLYAQAGQHAAALRQYDLCRQTLETELGVSPSAETTALYNDIRSGMLEKGGSISPALLTIQTTIAYGSSSAHGPPFMAPALPPQGVLGREDILGRLRDLLVLDEMDTANVPPAALHGMGGIGKTTLAIALGRQDVTPQLFPDGILWTTLGPSPTIRNLLDDWGRAMGENLLGERDEEACTERLRSALYRRRVLLIVDDVWEAAHGRSFMVAGPHCRILYTTRESPAAYALTTRERTLRVDVLQPPAALALLSRLAPEVVTTDEANARRLCERLEFLPLALTLAGRLLAQEADVPSRMQRLIGELIERREARLQLLQADGRLGLDPHQPVSLQAILGMSVARLSRADQERFAILSAFGGEPLTWEMEAAAYLWECAEEEAEVTISHFIQRGLVMQRGQQYWMHALLADYAAEMLSAMN